MDRQAYKWDFFLAHAGGDKQAAESLYDLLAPHCRVFLDSRCLLFGDNWEEELPEAQKNALITIVLVSANTEKAYYQREEIAGAIDMAREDKDRHRVVPVFLDNPSYIPYGLRLKHGLHVSGHGLRAASQSLLELLQKLEGRQTATGKGSLAEALANNEQDFSSYFSQQTGAVPTANNPAGAPDFTSPPDTNKMPGTNPVQQSEFKPYQSSIPPPWNPAQPAEFVLRCVFANEPVAYFVTSTNLIVAINPYGQAVPVGRRIPPTAPYFVWMYQTAYATHGVTAEGYIYTMLPNGQIAQVGYVTNPY